MDWFFGALFEVIASIHQAFVEDAVTNSKHMGDLMPHDAHGPEFDQVVVRFIFFHLEEALIVSRKRKDSGSVSDAC
jgi:hypothetical protein